MLDDETSTLEYNVFLVLGRTAHLSGFSTFPPISPPDARFLGESPILYQHIIDVCMYVLYIHRYGSWV